MSNRRRYFVGIYEIDMAYGGPEEGGWWYSTGTLKRAIKLFSDEDKAYAFARRANRLLSHLERDKRPVSSMAYEGDRHWVEVHADTLPEYYPKQRPQYS